MPFNQRKVTLCWPNLVDKCTLTSSSSNYTLPLDNLKARVLKKRARTTDLSFSITATLDASRSVGCVVLSAHNISVAGQWRVRLYDGSDELLEDSGFVDAWPSVFQTYELAWEDDNFWTGQPDQEDRERFTAQATWFADKNWYVKKVRIDITDASNPDSYIEAGRVFISSVWQPEYNASYGIQWGHSDESDIDKALDGTEYFDERQKVRQCSFALEAMSESEAFTRAFRLQRDQGRTREVFFSQELEATSRYIQRTMLCRMSDIDPVTHPDAARHTNAFALTEIL